MAEELQVALVPLRTQLDETVDVLKYLSVSIRMRAALGKALHWQIIDDPTRNLASDFMSFRSINTNVIYNGLYTAAMAAFEDFLRNILKAAVRIKVEQAESFKDIGEKAINRHFRDSGRILIRVHDQPEYLHVDLYEIARRLGTCNLESNNFELNDDALTNIPKLTQLTEFIKCLTDFGFNINIDRIAAFKDVKQALNVSGTRGASKQLTKALDVAVKNRNRIAHTGSVAADVTQQSLEALVTLLRSIADSICSCLQS